MISNPFGGISSNLVGVAAKYFFFLSQSTRFELRVFLLAQKFLLKQLNFMAY